MPPRQRPQRETASGAIFNDILEFRARVPTGTGGSGRSANVTAAELTTTRAQGCRCPCGQRGTSYRWRSIGVIGGRARPWPGIEPPGNVLRIDFIEYDELPCSRSLAFSRSNSAAAVIGTCSWTHRVASRCESDLQCAAAGAHALNNAKNQLLDVDQPSIHFLEFTVRKADGAPNQDRPFLRA